MNIYLLQQTHLRGYDTYDSAVVIAESAEAARLVYPHDLNATWVEGRNCWCTKRYEGDAGFDYYGYWPDPQYVEVTMIGVANPDAKRGVVCASFNAG